MTKQEFINGIEKIRKANPIMNRPWRFYHRYNNGLCEHIENNLGVFAESHFAELFGNNRTWYWSLDSYGHSQRDMALDIFEQNVLTYKTYKEF